MPKYVNIPAPWLPETLTMVRPKKDICNEALRIISLDKTTAHDDTVMMAYLNSAMNSFMSLPAAAVIGGTVRGAMCLGVCQPQRPQRKHVDSTIVEPKQLT